MEGRMDGWMDGERTLWSNAQRIARIKAGWNAWWHACDWDKLVAGCMVTWVDGWRAE